MALSRPPWPVFLIGFSQNPPLECKPLCDADSHSRENIRFQQSLKRCVDKTMKSFVVV